jgi:prepilin-type processing-associated H-X9-DG protein
MAGLKLWFCGEGGHMSAIEGSGVGAPLRRRINLPLFMLVAGALLFAAGLLLMKTVRDRARLATCVSNIKCLSLNLLTYAHDHGDRLPVLVNGKRDSWAIVARDSIDSADVLWCPADHRFRKYLKTRTPNSEGGDTIRLRRQRIGVASSYLMNPELSGVKITNLRNPVEAVLLEEIPRWHKGYRVVAYADGHAKALRVPDDDARAAASPSP